MFYFFIYFFFQTPEAPSDMTKIDETDDLLIAHQKWILLLLSMSTTAPAPNFVIVNSYSASPRVLDESIILADSEEAVPLTFSAPIKQLLMMPRNIIEVKVLNHPYLVITFFFFADDLLKYVFFYFIFLSVLAHLSYALD